MEPFVVSTGAYAYGGYPDIDGLFREQAIEHDAKKREAILRRIQQLIHDKVVVLPIWQLAHHPGVRPPRGRIRARSRRRLSVVGALRGREAQGEVRHG